MFLVTIIEDLFWMKEKNLFQHKLLKAVFESLSDSHITMLEIRLLTVLRAYNIQHYYYKNILWL